MRGFLFGLTAFLSVIGPGFCGDPEKSAELTKKVAPFVDEMTFLVGHVDTRRIDVAAVFKAFKDVGFGEKETAEARKALTKVQSLFHEAGERDVFVLLNWDAPRLEKDFLIVIPLPEKEKARNFLKLISTTRGWKATLQDDALLVTTISNFDRLAKIKPRERPELAEALAAFSGEAAKVILIPPRIVVRTFAEMIPRLPNEVGGGSTRDLGEGLRWLGAGVSEELNVTFRLQARDEKSARRFQDLARKAVDIPLLNPELQLLLPGLLKARKQFIPSVKGDQLVLQVEGELILETAAPLLRKARGSAARAQSQNNLRQIALAFHNYHDVHKAFPPAFSTDDKGRPLLSWRVHLLPYLEQDALYRQFKLDEPWDSPHNKKLADVVVSVYQSPLSPGIPPNKTTYLVPTGPKTIFEGPKGIHITKIKDGTSNTILVLEAHPDKAVFWTQPEDYPIDQKDLLGGLVHKEKKGFHAAFADGSVHWLPGNIAPATLRALLTASGGEPVGPHQLKD